MSQTLGTTPFGRRPLSLAMVASQLAAKAAPADATVHKWRIFRAITEAKTAIGVSDRALAVLNALLTFHQDNTMTGEGALIVFPSNRELALRAHGMSPATLRRHLAALVDADLVIRRDSPNGKRYARKGQGGAIRDAFGFDLTPLVARSAEFERLAEEAKQEWQAYLLVRERITLCRRDIAKMIAAGIEEGVPGDWQGWHITFLEVSRQVPRTAARSEIEPLADELERVASDIRKILEAHVNSQNMSANESQTEHHIHNSNPDPSIFESEPGSRSKPGATAVPRPETPRPAATGFPLGLVLKACPDIAMYARHGISNWRDFLATAELVRAALGVSPDAWRQACEVMGEVDASVMVAAMLQRSDAIKSPGGYLRSLTEKARAGAFSTGPVLMSLLRAQAKSDRKAS